VIYFPFQYAKISPLLPHFSQTHLLALIHRLIDALAVNNLDD